MCVLGLINNAQRVDNTCGSMHEERKHPVGRMCGVYTRRDERGGQDLCQIAKYPTYL